MSATHEYIPEGLRKQREWLAAQHAMQQPCWACGTPSSQLEAGSVSAADGYTHVGLGTCPYCHVPMSAGVALAGVGPCYWHWHRPSGLVVTATEWRNTEQEAKELGQ